MAEYQHIEYKLSVGEKHEASIALAAFATARGSEVRFGIAPDGRRIGVQIGKNSLEELANYIKLNTDPPLFPDILVEGDESSAVIIVRTEESPIKPVWAFGRPYKANVFHRIRLIERWGTGTLRMAEAYATENAPPPQFLYQAGSFVARLLPVPLVTPALDLSNLNDRQRLAIEYVLENGKITATQYGQSAGLERRQSQKDLTQLVEAGFLVRVGNGPATHYVLADDLQMRDNAR